MARIRLVTRHEGAKQWARQHGLVLSGEPEADLDPASVQPNDLIVGTLPVQLIAQVRQRGGRYWHMVMDIPQQARGTELSSQQMSQLGIQLTEFWPSGGQAAITPNQALAALQDQLLPTAHIAIASEQVFQNLLPMFVLPCDVLVLCDSNSKVARESVKRIKSTLQHIDADGRLKAPKIDVVNMPLASSLAGYESAAREVFEQVTARYQSHRLVLNSTGGTKLMSQALVNVFGPVATLTYCDTHADQLLTDRPSDQGSIPLDPACIELLDYLTAQRYTVIPKSSAPQRIERVLARSSLTACFVAQAVRLSNATNPCTSIELAQSPALPDRSPKSLLAALNRIGSLAGEAFEQAVADYAPAAAGALANSLSALKLGSKRVPPPVSLVLHWHPHRGRQREALESAIIPALIAHGLVTQTAGSVESTRLSIVSQEAAAYLAGGWLEEWCWLLIHAFAQSEPQLKGRMLAGRHWDSNVEICPPPQDENQEPDPEYQNHELDLAVVWRSRMLILEAKAGGQLRQADGAQAILNKLDRLNTHAAGLFGSTWLISAQDPGEGLKRRAKAYRQRLYYGKDLQQVPSALLSWLIPSTARMRLEELADKPLVWDPDPGWHRAKTPAV